MKYLAIVSDMTRDDYQAICRGSLASAETLMKGEYITVHADGGLKKVNAKMIISAVATLAQGKYPDINLLTPEQVDAIWDEICK